MAARKGPKCRTIDGVVYKLVPMRGTCKGTPRKAPARPRAPRKAVPASPYTLPASGRQITSEEFAAIVDRAARLTPPYHPNAPKALLHDVYRTAKPDLGGMSLAGFKERLRSERTPIERIDLPEVLTPAQRSEADFFGRGAHAIRNRK